MNEGKGSLATGKFPYATVALRPLSLVRRHPVIWLLAIFTGLGSGGSGFSATFPNLGTIAPEDVRNLNDPEFLKFLASAVDWFTDNIPLLMTIVTVIFIAWVVFWLISVFFGAAAIHASAEADEGLPVAWGPSVSKGRASFWRYLSLVVIFDVARLFVLALVGLPIFLYFVSRLDEVELHALTINEAIAEYAAAAVQLTADPLIIVVGLVAALLVFFLTLVLAVVDELSSRALILEELDALSAIRRAIGVIRRSLARTALVALIGGLASAIGSTVLAIVLVIGIFALIPVVLILIAVSAGSAVAIGISAAICAFVTLLVLAMALGGLLGAYFTAFWTVAYRRLFAGEA